MLPITTSLLIQLWAVTGNHIPQLGSRQRLCSHPALRPPTCQALPHGLTARYGYNASVPSIFRASWFKRWVITHSLADSDFHGHRPAIHAVVTCMQDKSSLMYEFLDIVLSYRQEKSAYLCMCTQSRSNFCFDNWTRNTCHILTYRELIACTKTVQLLYHSGNCTHSRDVSWASRVYGICTLSVLYIMDSQGRDSK